MYHLKLNDMKRYMTFLFALPVMMLLASCTDNITNMERTGYLGEPKTLTASEIRSEALPGQIKLYWSAPVATTYEYMKVSYVNPADGRRLTQVVSRHTSELLISNTLQKYGDYTFTFQAYNADGTAASPVEVKARSGKAPASYAERSRTRVTLTASQLSTDNQEPSEGPIRNLIDGNTSTFFHTRWSSPQKPLPQYIQINFNEEHENFAIKYTTRDTGNADGFPTSADLLVSDDGTNWTTVTTLSGLPASRKTDYNSTFFRPGKKFKYLRFLVTSTSGNRNYFHMSEFSFYDVDVVVDDPEAETTEQSKKVLVWSDEFEGTGQPDPAKWKFEEGFQRNHEDQYYMKEGNAALDGSGHLVITARRQNVSNPNYQAGSSDWKKNRANAKYTSASMQSRFTYRYGTVEVRAKIPTVSGSWPAIWQVGNRFEWPLGGEIDLMESYPSNGKPALHANYCWGTKTRWQGRWKSKVIPLEHFQAKDAQWTDKYHVWKLDWTPESLKIYVDDELLNEVSTRDTYNEVCDFSDGSGQNPFANSIPGFGNLIWLNLALGGDNGGHIDESAFPIKYYIDYVRVYQNKAE